MIKHNKFRILAATMLALAMTVAPALAQYAPTPNQSLTRPTYRAAIVGLVTAASATDFFTITGSATKTVQVTRAECNGIASTAATPDVVALKRSTANLTGTSTTPTAVPLDSSSPAATAVVRAYTVNPGTLGTLVGIVNALKMPLPLAATGADLARSAFVNNTPPSQPVTLRGATQVFALNGNAATLGTAAALDCVVEWLEN